jgi:hypothetical protein
LHNYYILCGRKILPPHPHLERPQGKNHKEILAVNERIILIWREGMDWVYLAEDKQLRRCPVNTSMNLLILYKKREAELLIAA